jgi:fucose 4-O-acetylase-like acetyltransferase
MENMKERIIWLDYFRVLAIYFVVVSHTPVSADFNLPLTYIRMPFFFLCSGLMFNIDKEVDFIVFLKKKAHSLLIPFVTFHAISYPFWLMFDRNFGADVSNAYPWYEPLPDIFLGRFAIDDAPLWFLTALFATEIIYYFIVKRVDSKWLTFVLPFLILLGYLSQEFVFVELPFMLQTVAVALIFYAIGHIFKVQIFALGKRSVLWHVISVVFYGVILYFVSRYNGKVAMHINQYGNFWLFLPLSVVALLFAQSLSVLMERVFRRSSCVEYISRNLIVIVGLHIIVGKLVKLITMYIFGLPLLIYQDAVLSNLIFSLVSILFLVPVMVFVNRYCPKVIGKFR